MAKLLTLNAGNMDQSRVFSFILTKTLASSGRGGMLGMKGRDEGGPRGDRGGNGVISWVFLVDGKGLVVRWIVDEVNSKIVRVLSHALQIYH